MKVYGLVRCSMARWMDGGHGKEIMFVNEALLMDQDCFLGRGMVDVFIG